MISSTPQQIMPWTNVSKLAATKDSNALYVLLADGSVYAAGDNDYGELGIGSTDDSSDFQQITALQGIVDITAGNASGYALDALGQVWAWGDNSSLQLGHELEDTSLTPVKVEGLPQIKSVGAAAEAGYAIDTTGQLWGWGRNGYGQLGAGISDYTISTPVMANIGDAVFVVGGDDNTYVIRADGSLWAAGDSSYGLLGNGQDSIDSNVFIPTLLPTVQWVSITWNTVAVVDTSGTVWLWGRNSEDGDLGLDPAVFGEKVIVPLKTGITGAKQVHVGWWYGIVLFG
jgi:alpha-tubulin suppressor-like RCC1 family protein